MKVTFDVFKNISFGGKREDRNNVKQLKAKNDYALTENNQRNIRNSIDNLAADPTDQNIKFLMNTAQQLQYATPGINLDKKSNNDWMTRLQAATEKALGKNESEEKTSLEKEFARVFLEKKNLTKDEKELLKLREKLLENKQLQEAMKNSSNETIKNTAKHLDYFVISSEITTDEKKACLEKFNQFMSPRYSITPQLKNKKPQVLAEILNDIIIKTPEEDKLTIKQVDQRHHGMCAAISISRKALAYEDKSKYVQSIMNELENTDTMEVYDLAKLGTGEKTRVNKVKIDFDYADEKGYRIIDASALQWMNIGGGVGHKDRVATTFSAFDKEFFDTFHDGHYLRDFAEPELVPHHNHLRALVKAKESVETAKKAFEKSAISTQEQRQNKTKNLETIKQSTDALGDNFAELIPTAEKSEIKIFVREFVRLGDDKKNKFFINDSEEDITKKQKMATFIESKNPNVNKEALKSKLDNILNMYELYRETKDEVTKHTYPKTPQEKARAYNRLYSVAGSYRTAKIMELNVPDSLSDYLVKYKVPDKETRLINNLGEMAVKVNDPANKDLAEQLLKNFGMKSTKSLSQNLLLAKQQIEDLTTTGFDDLYRRMLAGDRKTILMPTIEDSIEKIKAGDTEELHTTAEQLGITPDKTKVLDRLNKVHAELEAGVDNKRYTEILNNIGFKEQGDLLAIQFETLQSALMSEDAGDMVKMFAQANNIQPDDASINKTLVAIADEINDANNYIENLSMGLRVKKDGKVLNSVLGADVVMKILEKEGTVVSEPVLRKLQNKFNAIDKFGDVVEKAEIKGEKIKNLDAYKFDDTEIDTLNKIERDFNRIYHDVMRDYQIKNHEIDKPYSELVSKIGRETGNFWISEEGSSGLSTPQEIRIFENMTGRSYYKETDTLKSAEKIKKGPHSGVSTTSVYHNEMGCHAMYVADVAPLEVTDPVTGEKSIKDAIMHDNSWGNAEHKNVWKGALGLMRTDYQCKRGGATGYITDNAWRNGNLVEELINKPGVIDGEKIRLYMGTILPGNSAGAHSKTAQLVEEIFVGPQAEFGNIVALEEAVKKMPQEALSSAFERVEKAGSSAEAATTEAMDVINGIDPSDALDSEVKYNQLPKNHPLKLVLAQMALKGSYSVPELEDRINLAKSVEELTEIKKELVKTAKADFKYGFGKTPDTLRYAKNAASEDIVKILEKFEAKYDFKVKDKEKVVKDIFKVDKEQLDGKLSTTVDLLADNLMKVVARNVDDETVVPIIKEDLDSDVTKLLRSKMEFQLSDMDTKSDKLEILKKWIDKKYEPKSDADLVKYFRNIQEMSNKEFDEMMYSLSNEDIGIKDIKEYGIVEGVRNADPKATKSLETQIFLNNIYKDMNFSKTEKLYDHNKFEKKHTYSLYKEGKSFDDAYRELYIGFSNLTTYKLVEQCKDMNFTKYGARPAFPHIDVVSDAKLDKNTEQFSKSLIENSQQITALGELLKIYQSVDNIAAMAKDSKTQLTQENLVQLKAAMTELIELSQKDEDFALLADNAKKIIDKEDIKTMADVKAQTNAIIKFVKGIRQKAPIELLQETSKSKVEEIQKGTKAFIEANVQGRYRKNAAVAMQDWMRAVKKGAANEADLYADMSELITEKHLVKNPTGLLKEYIMLVKQNNPATEDRRKVLNTLLQATCIASSLSSIEYSLMNAAGDGNLNAIRNHLNNFKVPKSNTQYGGLKLGTDEGVNALINTMRGFSSDNNSTLWYLLNQMSLNEKAMELEVKNVDFAQGRKDIDNYFQSAKDAKAFEQIIAGEVNKVAARVDKNEIKPEDAVATVIANSKVEGKKQHLKKGDMLKLFKTVMDNTFVPTLEANKGAPAGAVLQSVVEQAMPEAVEEYFAMLSTSAQQIISGLQGEAAFVEGLDLNVDSAEDKMRKEFIENINLQMSYFAAASQSFQ